MNRFKIRALILLSVSIAIAAASAPLFLRMRQAEPIFPGAGVTQIRSLSDYFPGIKKSRGDTDVYLLDSQVTGATMLILGGAHPNEPGGLLTTVCLIENVNINAGRLIIIPRANNSAYTHDDPQEGSPQRFEIETKNGKRWFRYGSRVTNPIDQWPDPEVFSQYPSGQKLSGFETRNLNRAYPGRPDGTLTEKVAYAIMQLIEKEQVALGIDLHEAALEYPVINAIVFHPLAADIAGEAALNLQLEGLNYNLEPSPQNFHGLSHREWGDHLQIPAILMETANVMQGRYHGAAKPEIIITGKDPFYYEAAQHQLLEVEYPEEGIPLKERVGRHLIALQHIFAVWNANHPEQPFVIENIPDFSVMMEQGIGAFLN